MLSETTQIFRTIEEKYDVTKITYQNIPLWPVFRTYLRDIINGKIYGRPPRRNEATTHTFRILFKSFFYFNPLKLFKRYDIWLFTGANERRMFENKAVLRLSGAITEHFEKTLVWEAPFPIFHANKRHISDKNVISSAIFYGLTFLFESYFRLISLKINNESVLKQIVEDHNLHFKYNNVFYRFWAQYRAMSLLLTITKKPKIVLMICPWANLGGVLALKQKNIKVIEIQHGVINNNHGAYNSLHTNPLYSMDEVYVFGEQEKLIFEKENKCYIDPEYVYPVGFYLLEKIKKMPTPDRFVEQKKQYPIIIVIAGQEPPFEAKIVDFVNQAAEINKQLYFAYIPRQYKNDLKNRFIHANTGVFSGNIHEFVKAGDVHATIFSTTCLEANYLEKMNIFININNLSKEFYEEAFSLGSCAAYFADTPAEFVSLVLAHHHEKVTPNPMFFVDKHEEKIQELIRRHLEV